MKDRAADLILPPEKTDQLRQLKKRRALPGIRPEHLAGILKLPAASCRESSTVRKCAIFRFAR